LRFYLMNTFGLQPTKLLGMNSLRSLTRSLFPIVVFAALSLARAAVAQDPSAGDADRGKIFFQQSCAICHATTLGAGNSVIVRQGPDLVGVFGRRAGTGLSFTYTKAMIESGITWDPASLDRFLTSPMTDVPGTTMPISVPNAGNRSNLIAYLSTLTIPTGITPSVALAPVPGAVKTPAIGGMPPRASNITSRWRICHRLTAPFRPGNGRASGQAAGQCGAVRSAGFHRQVVCRGFVGPRLLRVAPNGDIFIAETRANRIRVLRAPTGRTLPRKIRFSRPVSTGRSASLSIRRATIRKWIYVANNNSVVRFPYHNGDLKARGAAQVIVPHLCRQPRRAQHARRGFFPGWQAHVHLGRFRLKRRRNP
jgi:cytochrome c2